jgi:hypothetical protein
MKLRVLLAACGAIASFTVASIVSPWSLLGIAVAAGTVIHVRASRHLRVAVEEKSRDLRQRAFEALAAMEGAEGETAEYTTTGSICVLVNRHGPDTLRVVVRGSADVLFYTLLRFDGFHATRDGKVWPMSRPEYSALE